MCSKNDCISKRRILDSLHLELLEKQLSECERCCFKNSKSKKYENETYKQVRLEYISSFWRKVL